MGSEEIVKIKETSRGLVTLVRLELQVGSSFRGNITNLARKSLEDRYGRDKIVGFQLLEPYAMPIERFRSERSSDVYPCIVLLKYNGSVQEEALRPLPQPGDYPE